MGEHVRILSGFALAIGIAYIAFFVNWISLDATKAVIIVGTIVLGFGGWILAAALVFFFVASSILTTLGNRTEDSKNIDRPGIHKRRDGYQVWANGFWVTFFCILWFIFRTDSTLIAAFASVAGATADTWATELGTLKPGKTRLITTLETVEPGTEGGISLKGTMAAIVGAAYIGLFVFISGFVEPVRFFFIILVSGLAGCFLDSVIGAVFLNRKVEIPPPSDFSSSSNSFTNSFINWAATGASGILAFLLTKLFLV